ncbi:energy transducer TonB, partial [Pseudomonas sp. HMWF010]
MIAELRRRAYLSAMQVASWLPRVELPFAAPSRPELLQPLVEAEPEPEVAAAVPPAVAEAAPAYE